MTTPPPRRWIGFIVLVFVLGPLLVWWFLRPPAQAVSVETFFPDHVSFALRLCRLDEAWLRHWDHHERGKDPEDALRTVLQAAGVWDRWSEDYGAAGARLRLEAYQRAVREFGGKEAWLCFGEWTDGQPPGTGEVGLTALIRARLFERTRMGPLVDLVMDDYELLEHPFQEVTIYEYRSDRQRRSLSFFQAGGWMCISLRQRGEGPLQQLIARMQRQARAPGKPIPRPSVLPLSHTVHAEGETFEPAYMAAFVPNRFWGHLRQFYLQRGRKMSPRTESRLAFWRQRLEGVDRVMLLQRGRGLAEADIQVEGPRPRALARRLQPEAASASRVGASRETRGAPVHQGNVTIVEVLQFEMSLSFAQMALPLAGLSWDQVLEGLEERQMWTGRRLPRVLGRMLGAPMNESHTRTGCSIYTPESGFGPNVAFWVDRPPLQCRPWQPETFWPGSQPEQPTGGIQDERVWASLMGVDVQRVRLSPEQASWHRFKEDILGGSAQQMPQAFLALDLNALARAFDTFPAMLLDRDSRERLAERRRDVRALALTIGSVVAWLETSGPNGWRVRTRTGGF